MAKPSLAQWLETPLGRYVLARELEFCDEVVADIFGFNATQLGLPQCDFLRASRIPLRFCIDAAAPAQVRAHGKELPVASQSMDLVLLPHVLEFAQEPHQILREVDRIMMPEGRLLIIGFNPWSLWGLREVLSASKDEYPWCGSFISLLRLKDWLTLLGFDVSAGRLACYRPPFAREKWLNRFGFMDPAGDRWWGIAGGIYMLQAIKRVQGMRLITPKWKERKSAEKAVAPVARREASALDDAQLPANVVLLPRKKSQ